MQKLRLPQARVLEALIPTSEAKTPAINREDLAQMAGFRRKAGTINRVLHGIPKGSSSGTPHVGLLALGLIEEIPKGVKGTTVLRYRITQMGREALERYKNEHGDLPPLKDEGTFVNDRYRIAEVPDAPEGVGETEIVSPTDIDLLDLLSNEGRKKLVLHLKAERSAKLIKSKKARVTAEFGKLICEVCDFDFEAVYGKLGSGFCEVHHRKPLGEGKSLDDLAILCSNCHRMIHHTEPMMAVEVFRDGFRAHRWH